MRQTVANKRQRGFSLIELMIVLIITILITAISITSISSITKNYRIGGDTRSISAQINLARMRAAAGFTHGRVYMDLSANTFHVAVWSKASACWQTAGETTCTATTSPVTALASGDTFGFGSVSAGPTAATITIAQAGSCKPGVAGASAGTAISSTACIEFNSRGYPVDSSNAIIASDAIYIGNNAQRYSGVAVSISGQPTSYRYSGSSWFLY